MKCDRLTDYELTRSWQNQRLAKNNMACNIGVTAASHFSFIEAANQGRANDSENYIVLDSKGWPMIWKIYWSWEAGGGPLLNILFSCKAGGGPWSEKYIEAEKQEDFTVPHVFRACLCGQAWTMLDSIGLHQTLHGLTND